jgi:hypothetical protein
MEPGILPTAPVSDLLHNHDVLVQTTDAANVRRPMSVDRLRAAQSPARRCSTDFGTGGSTTGKDDLPTVPSRHSRLNNAGDLGGVRPFVGDPQHSAALLRQRSRYRRDLPALEYTSIGFAGVCKCLSLSVADIEQPRLRSRLAEPNRRTLAVVEDVRDLVDDEIREGIVFREVLRRDVAGGFFAQANQMRCILPQQLRADACQVQVRERPRGAVEAAVDQERFDIGGRDEDDGLLVRVTSKNWIPLACRHLQGV